MKTLPKNITWLTIVILSLLFCGCGVYGSKVPISDSNNSTINDNWLGKWVGLHENEFQIYPGIEINLQAFNDKEYVATLKYFKNNGRDIRGVYLYKVFNTKLSSGEYLNIKSIGTSDENFIFYKIEEDLTDSIFIRYFTDTLNVEFGTSKELRDFLVLKNSKSEDEFLSQAIPFYRWSTLNWDRINKINKCNQFDSFYLLGKIKEDLFKGMSNDDLEELIVDKEEVEIDTVRDYFKEIQLADARPAFWKVPNYGVIKMKSGKFIKLKYDLRGSFIIDLTNDIEYFNRNEGNLNSK